jgi:hypothetical protein
VISGTSGGTAGYQRRLEWLRCRNSQLHGPPAQSGVTFSPMEETRANHPRQVRPSASVVFGLFVVLSVVGSAVYVLFFYLR